MKYFESTEGARIFIEYMAKKAVLVPAYKEIKVETMHFLIKKLSLVHKLKRPGVDMYLKKEDKDKY